MQGITGVNEKWRLKMTMAQPPYFCANSVNYLIPDMTDDFDYFILGILNSKLLNWYFAKLSTNSNVNGYEIDGLPIKMGEYYGAAEPPVRCGESHLSGLTEPLRSL